METNTPAAESKDSPFVKELLEKDFDAEVLKATLPVVVDFYSAESAPCKALQPRYGAVAEKFDGKVRFFKVLREGHAPLSASWKVTASPTLVFFKDGKETGERLTGDDIKRTALKAQVDAMLKTP